MKIFIHPMEGTGHHSACIGLGQSLAKRHHQVYFLIGNAFAGQFAKYSFKEILLYRKSTSNKAQSTNPIKDIAQGLLQSGLFSNKSSLEKMRAMFTGTNGSNFLRDVFNTAVEFEEQIEHAIQVEQPDLLIIDHMLISPAMQRANAPLMFVFSSNPLCLYNSDKLPPFCSGYATDSDPATWTEFRQLQNTFLAQVHQYQQTLYRKFNYTPAEHEKHVQSGWVYFSKYLNIFGFPKELLYDDIAQIPYKVARVDTFCREEVEPFELPQQFVGATIIFVSLGSMGSINVQLIQQILAALATTSHKYIVSKGPLADEYELPDNCWGRAFLPQTAILPLVDLVITHGGNNTVTEAFSFGKPMIVMPLLGDQFCNALRIFEKGYGIRVEPFQSNMQQELVNAIEKLLADKQLRQRCKLAAERIQKSDSKTEVCKQIEEVVAKDKQDSQFVSK